MATNKIKATVINLEQEVPKSGGSPWLMISEKAASAAMSSERPGMVAGSAQSLVGPKVSAGPAVGLAAPATGAAIFDTIKGRTLVWNQLADTSELSTSGTHNGVNYTYDAQTHTITAVSGTATATSFSDFTLGYIPLNLIGGHKYYIGTGYGMSANAYVQIFSTSAGNYSQTTESSRIVEIPSDKGASDYLFRIRIVSGTTANGEKFIPICIDLTAMFGAGYEPATVAEFEALFPESYYANNTGTLLPLRLSGLVSKDADDAELATLSLPIVGKTAKDGNGNPIVPYPTGMNGTPTVFDTATKVGGEVKWGVRDYEAGDESDATVITDLTHTAYPLATPIPFTWDEPLEVVAPVAEGGVLELQPEGVDEQGIPKTAPLAADIKWPVNAVSADTLTNLLDALKTAGVITAYTMTWDAATGAYTFTIS